MAWILRRIYNHNLKTTKTMKKVNDYSLNWSYKDTFNKVVNQVQMKSDSGYKINIKEEEKLNQDQIDFFHEICQEAIEVHSEEIIELINDLVMDYVADNEYEIFAELEDLGVITNEDYLKD